METKDSDTEKSQLKKQLLIKIALIVLLFILYPNSKEQKTKIFPKLNNVSKKHVCKKIKRKQTIAKKQKEPQPIFTESKNNIVQKQNLTNKKQSTVSEEQDITLKAIVQKPLAEIENGNKTKPKWIQVISKKNKLKPKIRQGKNPVRKAKTKSKFKIPENIRHLIEEDINLNLNIIPNSGEIENLLQEVKKNGRKK